MSNERKGKKKDRISESTKQQQQKGRNLGEAFFQ